MDLGLNPYLFRIGSFGVRWYGLFMVVSMLIGIRYLTRRGDQVGVDPDTTTNMAMAAIVGGIIGARLVYVLTNWGYFAANPTQIVQVQLGGLSIHGAIIGGLAAAMAYSAARRLPFWALADGLVPGAVVGIFLVRIGNIFNGEILGHQAAILGGLRHPAQIYEQIMALILWVVYWRQMRRNPPDGVPFWTFMLWYSVLRFVSELFRDNPHYLIHYTNTYLGIGLLTLEQLFTPLALGLSLLGLAWRRRIGLHTAQS